MRWIVAGVAAVAAVGAAGVVMASAGTQPAPAGSNRTVERVSSSDVTAKGTVQPISTSSVSFAISGTVTAVTVKAGDTVAKGQVLAGIDPSDAQEAVAQAQEDLDEAEAALTALQTSASATASPSSCTTSTRAPSTGASPSQGTSATASSCGTTTATGKTGGNPQSNVGQSLLAAKQAVNNKAAALAKAERELAGTVITAPVAGKVLSVGIKVGDTARSNVITLGIVSTMVVQASFSESDMVALTLGQTATVTLPGAADKTYTAKITQIAETGTTTDNLVTYPVLLTFDAVPEGILVGQSANVTVSAA